MCARTIKKKPFPAAQPPLVETTTPSAAGDNAAPIVSSLSPPVYVCALSTCPSPSATASFTSAACSLVLVSRFVPRPIRGTSVSPNFSFGTSIRTGLRSLRRARPVLRLVALGIPVRERQAGGASADRLRAREQVDDGDELAFAVSALSHGGSIAHRIRDVFEADTQPLWRPAALLGWRLPRTVAPRSHSS